MVEVRGYDPWVSLYSSGLGRPESLKEYLRRLIEMRL